MSSEAFDLRLAAPFAVLAEELHFGRAAQRLGMRQPALSQQLARLERQLGVQLVERGGGQVALTPAGARFLVEVREMLAQVALAQAALRGGGGELRLHLSTGALPMIDDVVGSFLTAHPRITVRTAEGSPSAAPRAVRAGEADVGFGMREDAPPDLQFAALARAPLGAVTAAGHRIAARGRAAWTDLEGEAVMVGPSGLTDTSNMMLRTLLRRMDVRVREVVSPAVPKARYLQHQLATGAAVLVCPPWALDPLPADVAWTVLEPEQHFEVGILWDDRAAHEPVRRFVAWVRTRARTGAPADGGGA